MKVSVIIPTYNRAHLILRSIKSVLNQTYKDFEIIVIDDGSTDGTKEVVKSISDARVKYYKLKNNHGQSYARNVGVKKAKYELIAFQDSDDEWISTKLEKQVNYLSNNPSTKLVYSSFIRKMLYRKKIFPPSNIVVKEGYMHNILLNHAIVGLPTVMIYKTVLKKIGGFDSKLEAMEDQELLIRISKRYYLGYVDESLVIAHGRDNISINPKKVIPSIRTIIKKHKKDYILNPFGLSKQYFKLLDMLILNSEYNQINEIYASIIKLHPNYIKVKIAYLVFSINPKLYKFIRKYIYY